MKKEFLLTAMIRSQEIYIYIGTSSPVRHKGEMHKFEFYYNASAKVIEVCYEGCNGTYTRGKELSDDKTTLSFELSNAFFEVKRRVPEGYSFREKKWLGRVAARNYGDEQETGDAGWPALTGRKINVHFDISYDPETRSLDVYYVGISSPHIRAVVNQDGSSTLPSEIHEAFQELLKNPQSNVDDHNSRCEECLASLAKLEREVKNYNTNNY